MNTVLLDPTASAVVEVDALDGQCTSVGCGGSIVRHSLGAAQSVHRCTRCFRRYQLRQATTSSDTRRSPFRRFLSDFVSWRDE